VPEVVPELVAELDFLVLDEDVDAVGEFASVALAPLPIVLPVVLPVGLPAPALSEDEEEVDGELDVVEFDRLLPDVVSLPVDGMLLVLLLPEDGLL
jgi:hypothetical protein